MHYKRIVGILIFLLAVNVSWGQQKEKDIPDGFEEVSLKEIFWVIEYHWNNNTGLLDKAKAFDAAEVFLSSLIKLRGGSSWFREDTVRVYRIINGQIYCQEMKK